MPCERIRAASSTRTSSTPHHDTLAYSDAMLLPGVALAPLFWAGIHPVIIYNSALFAAFALSGHATFLLARRLTGSVAAAMVAGVIYAFAPYRFTHYMHLELQLVFWIPLALLLFHRIMADGRVRDGVVLGLTVAAQLLSCIYVGIFSLAYFTVLVPALLVLTDIRQRTTSSGPDAGRRADDDRHRGTIRPRVYAHRAQCRSAQYRRDPRLQRLDGELPVSSSHESPLRMDSSHRSPSGRRDEPVPGDCCRGSGVAGSSWRARTRQIRVPRRIGVHR